MDQPAIVSMEEARAVVILELEKSYARGQVAVPTNNVQSNELGWAFFPVSAAFLESGNYDDSIDGLGPVVVERMTGNVTFLPSSVPPQVAVAGFWKTLSGAK